MAKLENWEMWYRRCAAARCTRVAQHDLFGFAYNRFRRYLQKFRPLLISPEATAAWHAFESYLTLGRTRSAKAWKSWLFSRGGASPTLSCIQGGATLIMRDVVRDYLRREHAPAWMCSLDAPLDNGTGSDTSAVSLADLLPDPADPIAVLEARDLQALVDPILASAKACLSARERIALTVHHAGKALSHRVVTQAVACSKSALYNSLHAAMQKVGRLLRRALPHESSATCIQSAQLLIDRIAEESKKKLEIGHPGLFLYINEESKDVG